MIQRYVNRQPPELKMLPFEEDASTTCRGDIAVGCVVLAALLGLILGWLV